MGTGGSNEDSSLSRYLKELRGLGTLSAEQERELAASARAGDLEARNRLIEAHLRFVVSVAKRYRAYGLPLEDLISEGNMGLARAVELYDAARGCRFLTYAVWWIRRAILGALRDKARMIRLPNHKMAELLAVQRIRERFRKEHGREPERSDLAAAMNVSAAYLEELLSLGGDVISLDAPLGNEEDASALSSTIADEESERAERESVIRSLGSELKRAMGRLAPREAAILTERFGLDGGPRRSLQEIGRARGLAKERVRQIEQRAIRKLRHSSLADRLKMFV